MPTEVAEKGDCSAMISDYLTDRFAEPVTTKPTAFSFFVVKSGLRA